MNVNTQVIHPPYQREIPADAQLVAIPDDHWLAVWLEHVPFSDTAVNVVIRECYTDTGELWLVRNPGAVSLVLPSATAQALSDALDLRAGLRPGQEVIIGGPQ